MGNATISAYEVDTRWKILRANDEFCRTFRCTEATLVGRDIRDLVREDWRIDFRTYIARALLGVGDLELTVLIVAPCGEEGWYRHLLEPLKEDGQLAGYRATIQPHVVASAELPKRWFEWRPVTARRVWDFDGTSFEKAS